MEIKITLFVFKLLSQLTQCQEEKKYQKFNNEFNVVVDRFFEFSTQLHLFSETRFYLLYCSENEIFDTYFYRSVLTFQVYKRILHTTDIVKNGYPFYEKTSWVALLYVLNVFCENRKFFDKKREFFSEGIYTMKNLDGIISDNIKHFEKEWDYKRKDCFYFTKEHVKNATNFFNNFNDKLEYNFKEINEKRKTMESLSETNLTYEEKKLYIILFVNYLNQILINQLDEEINKKKFSLQQLFFALLSAVVSTNYYIF